MKIIVLKDNNVVVRSFRDNTPVSLTTDHVQVGFPGDRVHYFLSSLNSNNSIIYENVQLPPEFEPEKFAFDGSSWIDLRPAPEVVIEPAPEGV